MCFNTTVDRAGLSAGIVSANERPVGHLLWSSNRSFNFVFKRGADATWQEETKAAPTPSSGG